MLFTIKKPNSYIISSTVSEVYRLWISLQNRDKKTIVTKKRKIPTRKTRRKQMKRLLKK